MKKKIIVVFIIGLLLVSSGYILFNSFNQKDDKSDDNTVEPSSNTDLCYKCSSKPIEVVNGLFHLEFETCESYYKTTGDVIMVHPLEIYEFKTKEDYDKFDYEENNPNIDERFYDEEKLTKSYKVNTYSFTNPMGTLEEDIQRFTDAEYTCTKVEK